MRTTTGVLNTAGSVVLDASGNGTVSFNTSNANQTWTVKNLAVYTLNTNPPVPVCGVFLGSTASRQNQQGATWSGNRATATANVTVGPCDTLNIMWTGGNPGDTATCVLGGTSQTKGA